MKVVQFPHPILRKKARRIECFDKELHILAEKMLHTMHEHQGVGLAAVQVNKDLSFFVVQPFPDLAEALYFVNPRLLWASEKTQEDEEGCLSLAGIYAKVTRPYEAHIEAQSLDGDLFQYQATGFEARVILHELDHLNGILFVDHLDKDERKILLKKHLENMRKKV